MDGRQQYAAQVLAALGLQENAIEPSCDLGACLEQIITRGREAWPGIEVEPEGFLAFLARHLEPQRLNGADLGRLPAADLWLAHACLVQHPAALDAFARLLREVAARLPRWRCLTEVEHQDLVQELWVELAVGSTTAPAGLNNYRGLGSLAGWLRVVVKRRSWRRAAKADDEELVAESLVLGLLQKRDDTPGNDPELAFLKAHYRAAFKVAFHQAMLALPARDREVLRQYVLEGLNIEQIGARHGVHRATVARWIARTRQELLADTRERLERQLGVNDVEADSILGLVASRIDDSFACLAMSDEVS